MGCILRTTLLAAAYSAAALTLLTVFFGQSAAIASPWGQEPGDIFSVSRFDYFTAQSEDQRFQRLEVNSFAEIGLPGNFTVGGKILYGTSIFGDTSTRGADTGISEIEGFVQKRIAGGELNVLALRLSGARPAQFDSGARLGLVNDGIETELRLLGGRTLAFVDQKLFATAEIAYRKRFGNGADQIRVDATIGYEPTPRWLLLADIFSITSARNEDFGGSDFDVIKLQPSVVRRFGRWGVQVGLTHEIAERNLLAGTTYFVGLRSQF